MCKTYSLELIDLFSLLICLWILCTAQSLLCSQLGDYLFFYLYLIEILGFKGPYKLTILGPTSQIFVAPIAVNWAFLGNLLLSIQSLTPVGSRVVQYMNLQRCLPIYHGHFCSTSNLKHLYTLNILLQPWLKIGASYSNHTWCTFHMHHYDAREVHSCPA